MKKEDAVEILEEVKMLDDSMYQYNPAYLEALNMAIESLRADATMDGRDKPQRTNGERTCYNCRHGAFGFDGDLGCSMVGLYKSDLYDSLCKDCDPWNRPCGSFEEEEEE